jgi:glycosyltransferase involved in cell wall biosynthesis
LGFQPAPWAFSEQLAGLDADGWGEILYPRFLAFTPLPLLELRRNGVARPAASGQVTAGAATKVSVILPTYNRPEMLGAAIDSVLSQTMQNFEIVVVNDAGVEVESVVSQKNTSGRITYVRHAQNRGLAAARNTGIKLAKGAHIAYLDDDDLYYPDHLQTLIHCLEHNDCAVAYTDAQRAHQTQKDGRCVVTHKDVPYSVDFNHDRILVGNFIPVLCVMHARGCLDEAGLFDESLTSHEDWDLWIRLSRKNRFGHIRKTTCEFSWRTDGSSMSSFKQEDFLRTIEQIYSKTREYADGKPHVLVARRQYLEEKKSLILAGAAPDITAGRVRVALA